MMESGDELLVNSKEEAINLDDEFYDLQPILAEIFSSDLSQYCNPVEGSIKSEAKHLNYNTNVPQHQEIISTKPSSSSSSSPSQLICFGKSSQSEKLHRILCKDSQIIKFSTHDDDVHAKKVMIRSPLQAQGHVMAERKRREKLSQLFITLSKAVPGLKKLDKASLLGDAIKYMQELKERVRILEEEEEEAEEANRNSNINSFSSKEISPINSSTREEIKARISNNNVMIKILYKKQKGLISRIQYEMENLHLNVLDIRALPFGSCTVDITVLAEMKCEFCGTVEDIVEHLQMAFLNRQA